MELLGTYRNTDCLTWRPNSVKWDHEWQN